MRKNQLSFFVPEKKLCVDNASMIAWAGIEIIQKQKCHSKTFATRSQMENR